MCLPGSVWKVKEYLHEFGGKHTAGRLKRLAPPSLGGTALRWWKRVVSCLRKYFYQTVIDCGIFYCNWNLWDTRKSNDNKTTETVSVLLFQTLILVKNLRIILQHAWVKPYPQVFWKFHILYSFNNFKIIIWIWAQCFGEAEKLGLKKDIFTPDPWWQYM